MQISSCSLHLKQRAKIREELRSFKSSYSFCSPIVWTSCSCNLLRFAQAASPCICTNSFISVNLLIFPRYQRFLRIHTFFFWQLLWTKMRKPEIFMQPLCWLSFSLAIRNKFAVQWCLPGFIIWLTDVQGYTWWYLYKWHLHIYVHVLNVGVDKFFCVSAAPIMQGFNCVIF